MQLLLFLIRIQQLEPHPYAPVYNSFFLAIHVRFLRVSSVYCQIIHGRNSILIFELN